MVPKKPNFIVIGAAKCGTTALASILSRHADCCMSEPKEVSFFQDQIDFTPNPNFGKGWTWYQRAFQHYSGELMVGEATPSYSDRARSPKTAQRIFQFDPGMKIIYMVRDPLERQISAWKMQWEEGVAHLLPNRVESQWALDGFETWLQRQKRVGQWSICKYAWQLDSYLNFFPQEQIHVSVLERWQIDTRNEIEKILKFLNLDPHLSLSSFQANLNRASDRRIEIQWLKGFRNSLPWRRAMQVIPLGLRDRLRKRFVTHQARHPSIAEQNQTINEFVSYVEGDSRRLLKQLGLPFSIWKTAMDFRGPASL